MGEPSDISDAVFNLISDADPTKKAVFSLSGNSTGTTRSYTLPNTSSELAILVGTLTFTGNKTFSGTLTASGTGTVSGATATFGTATGAGCFYMSNHPARGPRCFDTKTKGGVATLVLRPKLHWSSQGVWSKLGPDRNATNFMHFLVVI